MGDKSVNTIASCLQFANLQSSTAYGRLFLRMAWNPIIREASLKRMAKKVGMHGSYHLNLPSPESRIPGGVSRQKRNTAELRSKTSLLCSMYTVQARDEKGLLLPLLQTLDSRKQEHDAVAKHLAEGEPSQASRDRNIEIFRSCHCSPATTSRR